MSITLRDAVDSTRAFAAELHTKSQALLFHKSKTGCIKQDHDSWKAALDEQHNQMVRIWEEAKLSYPLLGDHNSRAQMSVVELEISRPKLEKKYRKLTLLLGSPHHQQALEFRNVTIKGCEAFMRAFLSIETKLDSLDSLLINLKQKVEQVAVDLPGKEPVIIEQTTLLYRELLTFAKFIAGTITSTERAPISEEIAQRIHRLIQDVEVLEVALAAFTQK